LGDDISTGAAVLALRIVVVLALYLFVLAVFRRLRSELVSASHVEGGVDNIDDAPEDWIEVVDCEDAPDLAGKLYPLAAISSIGREQGNTVTIPDPRISGRHARIEWQGGRWWVEDLSSANGTFLNGRAISEPTAAGYNDTLRVGPAVLRLRRPRRR
jgi:hypothetical protein